VITCGLHIPDNEASEQWFECLHTLRESDQFGGWHDLTEELFVFCEDSTLQVFAISDAPESLEKRVLQALKRRTGMNGKALLQYWFRFDGAEAIKAFLRVAIGLGHVHRAGVSIQDFRQQFDAFRSRAYVGPKLNKLYQRGIWLAEKVRMETNLQKSAISPESVMVELAEKIFGSLADHRALVVTNRFACRKFVQKLVENQIGELLFWRPQDSAADVSGSFSGRTIEKTEIRALLPGVDLLLVFNEAFLQVVGHGDLARIMSERKNAPLLYVNYLDGPKAQEMSKQVANIYNLYHYTQDDLQKVVFTNLKEHQKIVYVIDQLLEQEVENFVQWVSANEYYRFGNIIGKSRVMQNILELIARIAQTDITVLIDGPSGSGKEVIAKSIHEHSARRDRPFVVVNCGAIPENLLESELFGHVRGAFTGASNNKKGLFETANHGTIFLDEIGELSMPMQVKLLRFLQEGEIKPVGSNDTIKLDVRLIAATNRKLDAMIDDGTFRQDLYYRLNVIQITLPSLQERPEDIGLLADFFVSKYAEKFQKSVYGIEEDVRVLLQNHTWNGNVRELENVIERAVALAPGNKISQSDLPPSVINGAASSQPDVAARGAITLKELEKQHIAKTLEQLDWNYDLVAKCLGIGRTTLWRKMKEYGISNKVLP